MAKAINPQVTELLAWMKVHMPRVYQGVARRFVAQGELGGFWDTLTNIGSKVASSVNSFVSSEGFDKLLNVASPFLQTELEKQQLKLQIERAQQGLPLQPYQPAYTTPAQQSGLTWPSVPATSQQSVPWLWIAGGIGVGLLVMSVAGSRR